MPLKTTPRRVQTTDLRRVKPPAKTVDPYYKSEQHQKWRESVLKRAGFACQDCGRSGVRLFADHVVELRDGGDPLGEGRALCQSCHGLKTARERDKRAMR